MHKLIQDPGKLGMKLPSWKTALSMHKIFQVTNNRCYVSISWMCLTHETVAKHSYFPSYGAATEALQLQRCSGSHTQRFVFTLSLTQECTVSDVSLTSAWLKFLISKKLKKIKMAPLFISHEKLKVGREKIFRIYSNLCFALLKMHDREVC